MSVFYGLNMQNYDNPGYSYLDLLKEILEHGNRKVYRGTDVERNVIKLQILLILINFIFMRCIKSL